MKNLNKLMKNLKSQNYKMKGCNEDEILKIVELSGGKLPISYIEFLEVNGIETIGLDSFLVGNSVFYDDLFDNKEAMQELLDEDNSKLTIPDNAFVFYCSQGILYCFFNTNEGDNPPVYCYAEGFEGVEFLKITDSLSDFYEAHLEGKNIFNILYNI